MKEIANNLCPNHRDKQRGKPCLACEVERLEFELDQAESAQRKAEARVKAGEKVAEALESCITALTDPRNGEWPWVENGHMHEHFRDVSESAKSALSAYTAAKSQSEPKP